MKAYCVRVADCNNIYIWQRLLNHSAESHNLNFISSVSLKRNYDWVSRTLRGRLEPDAERWPSRSFVLTRWWWCRQEWRLKRPFNSREWSTTRRWWRPVIEWSLGEFRHMGSKVRGNERGWKGGFGLLLVVSLWRCLETRKYPSNAQERKVVLWDRQWKNERLSTVFFVCTKVVGPHLMRSLSDIFFLLYIFSPFGWIFGFQFLFPVHRLSSFPLVFFGFFLVDLSNTRFSSSSTDLGY